jgi:NADPH-dependent 7-cyano-7-deazaguanine reductase QueF-like protein
MGLTIVFGMLIASAGQAGKPVEVIMWSNGFPSGEHFNLNIHGKKADFNCNANTGGASVFVPVYGDSVIELVQNKRSSLTELSVQDNCGGFDGDSALVQLPAGEYQVYARILAKPQKENESREVVIHPILVEACNDTQSVLDVNGNGIIDIGDLNTDLDGNGVIDDTDLALYYNFSDAVDCSDSFLLGTGVVTSSGVFDLDSQEFTRKAGKTKAVDITALFQWSGYACDQMYDSNNNGEIDLGDLEADLNGDNIVDEDDLALYLSISCTHFDSAWIYDIADLVVYGWDYMNNGSKLVQTRFYPVKTTTFE